MGQIKNIKLHIVTDIKCEKKTCLTMGRMRRQRRYKACDPFAKNTKKVNERVYDLAPKKKGDDDDHFKESKRFLEFQQRVQRAMGKGGKQQEDSMSGMTSSFPVDKKERKKKKRKEGKDEDTRKKSLQQGPNESKKEYFQRLDANVNYAINTSMMDSRTLRKKRKLHLKARDEKKKKKAKKDDIQQLTETKEVTSKFGEYVEAPPDITALPRKANQENNSTTPTSSNKYKGLKLMSLLEGKKDNESSSKPTAELSKEALEKERERAIDAYRQMKKNKNA